MSEESYERLQELSSKYGVSSSGFITLLVNERWLKEKELAVKTFESEKVLEEEKSNKKSGKRRPTKWD